MKHYKKILFIIILFMICGVVQAKGTFTSDTYYKNVCGVDFIPENLPNAISGIYNAVKSLLPVVIIILGMFDFLKAVMAGKQDEAAKNTNKFIRRIISGLLIFLILAIVQFVFKQLGNTNSYFYCMNCFLNNDRCGATYVKEEEKTCESYSGEDCPSEVGEVKCETVEKLGKKYCRSVCNTLKKRTQCDSRAYCDWDNKSGCDIAKVRIVPAKSNSNNTSNNTSLNPSSSEIVYPQGQYGFSGPVPYYRQCDSSWGSHPFPNENICESGCGPTSTAMVASALLHDSSVTPPVVGDYIVDKGLKKWHAGYGTSLAALTGYLNGVGLKYSNVSSADATINALKTGSKLAIVDVSAKNHKSCPFTSAGHYIVVTSYNNGQFYVLDPNSKDRSKKFWPANDIFGKCKIVGIIIAYK